MRLAKPALAALLAGLLLLCTASSSVSSIHQWLHHENTNAGSGCVVCLMLHGLIDVADVAPVQGPAVVFLHGPQVVESTLPASKTDLRLAPGRAPPLG